MIELSFSKLINHQRRTASSPALRMLLEKKPVSKRKRIFFTVACCFFMRGESGVFTRKTRAIDPRDCIAGVAQAFRVIMRACLEVLRKLRAVLQDAALTCRER